MDHFYFSRMNSLHQTTIIASVSPSSSINRPVTVDIKKNQNKKELKDSGINRLQIPEQKILHHIKINHEKSIHKKNSYSIVNDKIGYNSHSNEKFYLPVPKLIKNQLALIEANDISKEGQNFIFEDSLTNKDSQNIPLSGFKTPETSDKNSGEPSYKNKLSISKKYSFYNKDKKIAIRSQDVISKISNFYDTDQISSAVFEINETQERVKMIDMILKRREEMKKLEDEFRFQKLYHVLKRFAHDIKKRLKNNVDKKSNFSQTSAKFLVQQETNEDTIIHPIVKFEKSKTETILERPEEVSNPTFSKKFAKLRPQQAKLKPKEVDKINNRNSREDLKKQEIQLMDEKTSLNIIKFAIFKKIPQQKDYQISNATEEKIRANALKKCTFFGQREVLKENLEAASRTVENDLYNYLLQSEKNGAASIILGETVSAAHKNFKIKNIELNVKKKFENHKNINHKKNYHPSNIQLSVSPLTFQDESTSDVIKDKYKKINRIRFSEPSPRKIFYSPTPTLTLTLTSTPNPNPNPNPNPPSLISFSPPLLPSPPEKKMNSISKQPRRLFLIKSKFSCCYIIYNYIGPRNQD